MTDLAALRAELESLKATRRSATLKVRFADREVTYKSDAEMVAAIAATENEIAALEGTPVVRSINVRSKGWS